MPQKLHVKHKVYSDDEIAVSLVKIDSHRDSLNLAIKWSEPQPYRRKEGELVETTNLMGGETDWFIVPFSLAVGVARVLIEQKVTGLSGFDESGFSAMVRWLVELEELNDAMCY